MEVFVLLLPDPFLRLIMYRKCRMLVLLLRWHRSMHALQRRGPFQGPFPGWPPPDDPLWLQTGNHRIETEEEEFGRDGLVFVAETIRKLGQEANDLEHVDDAKTVVRLVVAWQDALDGGASNTVLQSSVALVEGIRLMAFLRGRANNIADVVQRALAFALPPIFVKTFQEQCKGPGRQPSPSILRYHELSFDVAIMVLEQRAWNRKSVRYDWSDSSPQAGYNWLWGQCRSIDDEQLPDILFGND